MLEWLYVLFLLSGYLKSILVYYEVTPIIDLTTLLAILVIGLILVKNRQLADSWKFPAKAKGQWVLLGLFSCWIVLSLFWSTSQEYKWNKLLGYCTAVVGFLIPFLMIRFNTKRFFQAGLVVLLLVSLWFIPVFSSVLYQADMYVLNDLYLGLGLLWGVAALWIFEKPTLLPKALRNLSWVLIIAILGVIFLLGARGPLLLTLFWMGLSGCLKMSKAKKENEPVKKSTNVKSVRKWSTVAVAIMVLGLFTLSFWEPIASRSWQRFSFLWDFITTGEPDLSIANRFRFLSFAWQSITENWSVFFWGQGFGSFGFHFSGHDKRLYPHNLIIETWYELGLVGVTLIFGFLFSVFFYREKAWSQYLPLVVILYFFSNHLKSGSLADLRLWFGFMALYSIQDRFWPLPNETKKAKQSDANKPPNTPAK